ncbi:MAG: hypothetical protein LBO03_04415 [Acidaminococcales bacterium]|jgi:hypothetical protein|nr:hypothetical protein [Acidaminococcales bacterium]
MATDKRQFTLRVQDDTFKKISYIAQHEHRSIAMQIEHILLDFIAEFEKRHGDIKF